MNDKSPVLRVSAAVVKAAQLEVVAMTAAGLADQVDPMVRKIANAHPVLTREGGDPASLAKGLRDAWVTRLCRGADEGLWDAVVDVERAFGLDAASRPQWEQG